MLVSVGLPVSANAINKDVGVHTKMFLNVRHRVVSPTGIAERTASLETRLKLLHVSGLRGDAHPMPWKKNGAPPLRRDIIRSSWSLFFRVYADSCG